MPLNRRPAGNPLSRLPWISAAIVDRRTSGGIIIESGTQPYWSPKTLIASSPSAHPVAHQSSSRVDASVRALSISQRPSDGRETINVTLGQLPGE